MTTRRRLIHALPLAGLLAACATPAPPPGTAKPAFVLVHGAFQDERAWSEVVPLLQRAGHRVHAVRLPGRAGDATPPSEITLDAYRARVGEALRREPRPVVLVGHSFGGLTIANVAETWPDRVKALVFVAAYLPQVAAADQSMAKLAGQDRWNGFTRENFIVAGDGATAGVLERDVVSLFCNDCSAADQARTLRDFHPREPLKPAGTPVVLSAQRYGRVPKVYVRTLRDRAISPQMQQAMIDRTPVRRVVTIDSGHAPFLSQPLALAQALLEAAGE